MSRKETHAGTSALHIRALSVPSPLDAGMMRGNAGERKGTDRASRREP